MTTDLELRYCEEPVERSAIAELEKEWGVKFPPSFIACTLKCHGGTPALCDISVPGGPETTISQFARITRPADGSRSVHMRAFLLETFPERVFPFAVSAGGDTFCFDYRGVEGDEPRIAFLDHTRYREDERGSGLLPLAESFDDFLGMLFREDD